MFIEDYILGIAGYGSWVFSSTIRNPLPQQDETFFESVAASISNGNALTEKQGTLALKLIKNNLGRLDPKAFPDIVNDLANPQWKQPFRVIPVHRTITISKHVKYGRAIYLEFPYEEKTIDDLRGWNKLDRNRGSWDSTIRKWVMTLREDNILMIGDRYLPNGFDADDEFLKLFEKINNIRANMDQHLPMILASDNTIKLINHSAKIPQLATDNIVEALFIAREYGITTWDDTVEEVVNHNEFNLVTRGVLKYLDGENYLWFHSDNHDIALFNELLTYGGTALVIVPGGSEYDNVKQWSEYAESIGITKEQQSVMFRLPNGEAQLNIYVKERGLNNPVTEATRMVFVSTKIPKPLVKDNIKFSTVINLGFYNTMHFTMNTMIANARNLVYYSIKEPSKVKRYYGYR
jgi:hypothetical protein